MARYISFAAALAGLLWASHSTSLAADPEPQDVSNIGFVLYTPLFAGAASGLAAGTLSWRVPDSLQVWLPTLTQRLRLWSMLGFVLFSALSGLVVWRSALRL